jgi:hypothetical protein
VIILTCNDGWANDKQKKKNEDKQNYKLIALKVIVS